MDGGFTHPANVVPACRVRSFVGHGYEEELGKALGLGGVSLELLDVSHFPRGWFKLRGFDGWFIASLSPPSTHEMGSGGGGGI